MKGLQSPLPNELSSDYWICAKVDTDHWVEINGGRLNLSHYYRVMEAKLHRDKVLINGRAAA
jgi:hypothetical protein